MVKNEKVSAAFNAANDEKKAYINTSNRNDAYASPISPVSKLSYADRNAVLASIFLGRVKTNG